MNKKITVLHVSEPAGLSYMLNSDRFEQIDENHVKFDAKRDVTLNNLVIEIDSPHGERIDIKSINVRLIETVTATIVDVYGKLETRNVEETILDLEFLDIYDEITTISRQRIKSILIDRLNEAERFEKLVGNVSIVAK